MQPRLGTYKRGITFLVGFFETFVLAREIVMIHSESDGPQGFCV
jgi:hypothetical protein